MDRNKRRFLRSIGAAGLAGFTGVSAGQEEEEAEEQTPDEDADGGGSGQISWWNLHVQGVAKEAAAEIESAFEEQSGIDVEQTKYENTPYKSAITNALGTSEAPDVFYIWPGPTRLGRYVGNGNVISVDDVFPEEERDAFLPDAIQGVKYEEGEILSWRSEDGQMFAYPADLAAIPIWYNKNVLEDAGVDTDRLQHATDVEWEEFLTICSSLADAGVTPIEVGNRNRWTIGHWVSAFMIKAVGVDAYLDTAYGLNDVSFTDEPYVTALSRLQELYDEGYLNRDANSLNNNEAASLFFNDQAGFWHQGTWIQDIVSSQAPDSFEGIPDAIDYMWWPYFPDLYENGQNERLGVVPNSSYAVSSQAEQRGEDHLADVLEFLEFFSSKEAQTMWFEITGEPVTRPEVFEEVDMTPAQETITATVDELDAADAVGPVFDVSFLPEASETLLSGGQELFTGESPESILQDLQESNEEALSEV